MDLMQRTIKSFCKAVGSGFFTAEFVKKDGTLRKMNCRLNVKKHLNGGTMRYDPLAKGMLPVYDMQKKGYRIINFNTIKRLKFGGRTWEF